MATRSGSMIPMNNEAHISKGIRNQKVYLIAAMDRRRVIGNLGQLPWDLPSDMVHFMKLTMGKTLVMGRKTYQSIGKALPGRENLVLSRDPQFRAPGCTAYNSLEKLLDQHGNEELFVIGGSEIYSLFLPLATRLYITLIHHEFKGDCFFPQIPEQDWTLVKEQEGRVDQENHYEHRFLVYEKL
jgi:dihydrofolate reductase